MSSPQLEWKPLEGSSKGRLGGEGEAAGSAQRAWAVRGRGRHQLLLDLLLLNQADLLQLCRGHALPAVGDHAVGPEGAGCLLRALGEQVPLQQVADLGQVVLLFLLFL